MSKLSRSQTNTVLTALLSMAPRKLWLGGMIVASATVLMGMALLGLSGWFIAATAIAGLVPASAMVFDVFVPSAGIRLLALGRTGSRYAERLLTHDATLAVLAALRGKLFRAWVPAAEAWQLRMRPARWLQRLTSDVDALDGLYLRTAVPVASALAAALLLTVVLCWLGGWIDLAIGAWLLCSGLGIALWLGRRTRQPSVKKTVALERLRTQAVDLVAGQTDLLMVGKMPAQLQACDAAANKVTQSDARLAWLEAWATAAWGVAGTVLLVAVLVMVTALAKAGVLDAPQVALALLVALAAMEPFAALRRGAAEAGRTFLALKRLAPQILQAQDAPENGVSELLSNNSSALPSVAGNAVELHAMCTAPWGCSHTVLGPLSLQIAQGECVAVVGPSGAGKSTLLSVIAGELPVLSGQALAVPSTWLGQKTELFQDSLRDNLLLARPDASDELLWQVLEEAGLAADVRAMPQQLDSILGEGGLGLSGGQARRLALSRLLLNPAALWLLDEPTESLDDTLAQDVLQRLQKHLPQRTTLIATHYRREAALATRLIWVEQGVIVADLRKGTAAFEVALARLHDHHAWLERQVQCSGNPLNFN